MSPPLKRFALDIEISEDDLHPDRLTNHVNNARYFAFINQTFQQWYALMGTRRGVPDHGAPVAHLSYDFKRELFYPGQARCVLNVVRVGNTSMEHAIHMFDVSAGNEVLVGTGKAIHVWRNRITGQSVPWPSEILAKCWPQN